MKKSNRLGRRFAFPWNRGVVLYRRHHRVQHRLGDRDLNASERRRRARRHWQGGRIASADVEPSFARLSTLLRSSVLAIRFAGPRFATAYTRRVGRAAAAGRHRLRSGESGNGGIWHDRSNNQKIGDQAPHSHKLIRTVGRFKVRIRTPP